MYTLEEVKNYCKLCQKCDLYKNRTNVVFGEGNVKADIMFIGEGPGYNEDIQGRPFVGVAGQLLTKMIKAINLDRKDVYITNIVKCRPPNNRNPFEKESEKCIEYLRWQVKLINPKIIVCLGAVSGRNIISPNFRVTMDRGKWFKKGTFNIIATFHPAAILRDKSKKKPAWDDFKSIKAKYNELT
ncbi:uracil-DNA glycosylase [Thermohalobacter berrensis]|uniref:Type-4 uracil-DNA glycosylase n=1 Tax=Thermohalobacter berrensis TaxID=99594 RepID=A0A419T097_9FIRM|nr:uracil-DNA glycosylase [Thermohalobacter berrensis]RKD30858.1 uracil-DNA glycosylase [Thermohalobacter berrensis]